MIRTYDELTPDEQAEIDAIVEEILLVLGDNDE